MKISAVSFGFSIFTILIYLVGLLISHLRGGQQMNSNEGKKSTKKTLREPSEESEEIFHSGKYDSTVVIQDFFRKRNFF